MSSLTLTGPVLMAAQEQFEEALPDMDKILRHYFRSWPPERRQELIADARAALWAAWHSLTRRGRDPVQLGITGIAARCCRYVRSGRKVGNRNHGRGCLDVLDHRARRRLGIEIISLDRHDETTTGAPVGAWRQWLAESNFVTPADEAAFRVDFGRWLADLPDRKRMMAEMLAEGHETGAVARRVGVSPGRVSQVRLELEANWTQYQSQAGPADSTPVRRPRGRPRKADQGTPRRPRQRPAMQVVQQDF